MVEVRQGAGGEETTRGDEERRRGEERRREERRRRRKEDEKREEKEEDEDEEDEEDEEEATDIKSNNPHLAGGEKIEMLPTTINLLGSCNFRSSTHSHLPSPFATHVDHGLHDRLPNFDIHLCKHLLCYFFHPTPPRPTSST